MGMLNNTKVQVSYPLEELLQIAFKNLARQNLVPHTHSSVPIDYECRYHLKNKEGKVISNDNEITVSFGLVPKEKPPEKEPYEAGDWKDPEVDKIINEQ